MAAPTIGPIRQLMMPPPPAVAGAAAAPPPPALPLPAIGPGAPQPTPPLPAFMMNPPHELPAVRCAAKFRTDTFVAVFLIPAPVGGPAVAGFGFPAPAALPGAAFPPLEVFAMTNQARQLLGDLFQNNLAHVCLCVCATNHFNMPGETPLLTMPPNAPVGMVIPPVPQLVMGYIKLKEPKMLKDDFVTYAAQPPLGGLLFLT